MAAQKTWISLPLNRDAQLEAARQDLGFANENKITYAVLASRINEALGTKWDKGHARRFILNADSVRGAIFGNTLSPAQVSTLRHLAAHIKEEVESGLNKTFAPPLEASFGKATKKISFGLELSAEQSQIFKNNPKLRDIMKSALQITAVHVLQAYEAGVSDERSKPESPAP